MSGEKSSRIPAEQSAIDVPSRRGRNSGSVLKQHLSVIAASFSGPLPPPDLLQGYEDACHGAADRIIRVAELEAEHRRLTETAIVKAGTAQAERESNDSKRGQIFALLIVLASITAGSYLGMNGHEFTGSVIGLGGVGSIVTTFVLGRSRPKPDEKPP